MPMNNLQYAIVVFTAKDGETTGKPIVIGLLQTEHEALAGFHTLCETAGTIFGESPETCLFSVLRWLNAADVEEMTSASFDGTKWTAAEWKPYEV